MKDLAQKIKQMLSLSKYEEALGLLMDGLNEKQRTEIIDQLLGNEEELRKEDEADRMKRKEERIKEGKWVAERKSFHQISISINP